jgi:hypothetical protein
MKPTHFPFGQPQTEKDKPSKDCGYRCLWYAVNPTELNEAGPPIPYDAWLKNFRFFQPVKSGITFTDICAVLDYYKRDFRFTQLVEEGLFIVYSGIWLRSDVLSKKHGHYFCYHDGVVLCSTHQEPYRLPLREVISRLEAKTIDHAFRCLKVL